jgi:hypothetical protein
MCITRQESDAVHKIDQVDDEMFTATVLMISSAAGLARDELDKLIAAGDSSGHDVQRLLRARSGVAALAAIADHYERGD